MANTGNTQQQINYGNTANDGLGDPLRTAFIKTDENFDNIWLAGPVGSNITIGNNTIQSNNTNGNIIIKPNGVGVIQANAAIMPNAANVRDLGSAALPFRAGYFGLGGVSVSGNVTVTGNLTAGNIKYTGNVFVGDLQGSVFADDSTIMVDAVDNAMFADEAIFGRVSATGNVIGTYIKGNGSQLTGMYANANVAAYLPTYTGNLSANNISAGNVFTAQDIYGTTGSFSGDSRGENSIYAGVPLFTVLGSDVVAQFSANVNNYTQLNFQNGNSQTLASGDFVITADNGDDETFFFNMGLGSSNHADPDFFGDTSSPNDAYLYVVGADATGPGNTGPGNLIIGSTNGVIKMFVGNTAQANVVQTLTTQGLVVTGNITPSTNAIYSLGNSTNYWSNLWVANNTIYIGGVPLGITAGNVLTVDGEAVLSNDSDATITTTGNITADYFFGNGSQLTGLSTGSISNGTSNVEIATANGNVTINTNGTYAWSFDDTGNLALPNNGSIIVDGGDGVIGPVSDDMVISWDNEEIRLVSVQGSIEMQADNAFRVQTNYDGANVLYASRWEFSNNELVNISGDFGIVSEAGNLTLSGGRDGVNSGKTIISSVDLGNAVYNWTFGTDSVLTTPGDINIDGDITGTGSLEIQAAPNGNAYVNLDDISDSYIGAAANLSLLTDADNREWIFDTTGTLTTPGDITVGGDVTGRASANTLVIKAQPNTDTYIQLNSIVDSTIQTFANLDIVTDSSNTARTFTFGTDGVLTTPGNIATDWLNIGNVGNTATLEADVSLQIVADASGSAPYWVFNTDGNLQVPGNINGDNNAPLVIDGASAGLGYISLPHSTFGGEQIKIVNQFSLGNGISLTTGGGEWHFADSGAFFAPGAITANGDVSGQVLKATQSAANEGGEIQLSLPSSGTTLTGNIIIDSYQNLIRFFESGNSRGVFVDVPNVSVSGQYAIGYRDVPQIALTGNITANSITAGKHFYSTTAGNLQITLPDNANVAFPLGATLTVVVNAAGNVVVAQDTGVSLYMAGSSSTGNRTVGAYGLASVMKVATDTWVISGTGVY